MNSSRAALGELAYCASHSVSLTMNVLGSQIPYLPSRSRFGVSEHQYSPRISQVHELYVFDAKVNGNEHGRAGSVPVIPEPGLIKTAPGAGVVVVVVGCSELTRMRPPAFVSEND